MVLYWDKVAGNARKNPDKVALVDENGRRETTYRQLVEWAQKFAAFYMSKGLKNDDIIIVAGARRSEFIAAELGAFLAGCGVAPVNVKYPKERIEVIREDCNSPLVMTESMIQSVAGAEPCGPVPEKPLIQPDNIAFLIYTSGSTGKPKGIYCDYKCFSARCTSVQKLSETQKVLSMAPFFFVASLGNLFSSLGLNHTIHIASEELMSDIRAIEDYIYEHKITNTFLSPQMLRLYVNKSDSLQVIATGSEKVTGFQKGNYTVLNAYGMSESLGVVLSYATKDGFHEDFPIGKPQSGYEVYLLDDELNPVADGEEGEIVVSGMLANGYYHMPEATAKVFLENPFAKDEEHKRMYRTGDIGRKDKDGNILYVNRKDWMVKINGQRVEPGEIEQQIRRIPEIDNAVVKAFTNPSGQVYLCAYYIPKMDMAVEEQEIREFLKKRLASYMIPSFYIKMDRFPLNQNNKIDRLSLKAPELQSFHKEYSAPVNDKEKCLCDAFEKVLQCGEVGRNDDFFALGGNSINVLMMISECGLPGITSATIFSGRTPAKIAARIRVTKDVYAGCMEEKETYPLTDSQMGVYLECMANPDSTMYNIPLVYRAARQESLNLEKLKYAIEAAIENHPALIMELGKKEDLPVMKKGKEKIKVHRNTMEESQVSAYIERFIRPFALEKEPLCRAEIVETKDNVYLLFDMHHMVFDGTSSAVLFEDMMHLYQGEEIQPEQITMFHQSIYEEKLPASEEYQTAMDYFDQLLNGIDVDSNLISDRIVKDGTISGGGVYEQFILEETGQEEISGFLRGNGFTENTLFMSAFAYTLAKFSNQQDVFFCTVNNGRHDVRLEHAVGMFVRTMPVYLKIAETTSPVDFLADVQDRFMETMEQDICSFSGLARKYGINSDIMFVYQDELVNSFELGDVIFKPQKREIDPQANITVMVFKRNGKYEIHVEYQKGLYSPELIHGFVMAMDSVLQGMLQRSYLADIPMLNAETESMIDTFNQTETEVDLNCTVAEQFRKQAKLTPGRTAVVYKETTLTYQKLDEMTERIAQNIGARGIGPEDVVAILINRSENMPVTALSVLKTGAGYQPLDATYPPERLQFMIEDSKAKLLIADEELLRMVPKYQGDVLLTKEFENLEDTDFVLQKASPDNLFIMLYTSGTTGLPKGCMLENRSITCFIDWYKKYNHLTEESVAAQYASFGFDACMMDMYPILTCGGKLVIVGEDIRLDLAALDQYFQKERVSVAFMTTQVGRFMAENMKNDCLKRLGVGGEKLVPFERKTDCIVSNVYGPTETTILATCFPIDKNYTDVPIGKAIANVKLYVVDAQGRLLPPGMPGELWIAGPQVSRGYLNREEQTAKAYTINPFTEEKGYERIYHTGDIVRYLSDGNIQFIGRRDAQVKIRGFRIELTEVEGVIREYPGIKDATVAAFDEAGGGKYVAAYVVSEEMVDIEKLNAFILERKPPYMVPAVTMQIDSIPLNQNQKVNRRALPVPERKVEEITLPENDMQQKIFDIISEVIGHKQFGVTTDIYLAGLTSIGAVKLNVILANTFDITMKIKDLKENPTVKQLERFIIGNKEEEKFELQADYPLTQTQQGIFVECMAHPGTTIYNIPALLKIDNSIDIDRLAQAVKKAVNAHSYIKGRIFMNEQGDIRIARKDDEMPAIEIIDGEPVTDQISTIYNLVGDRLYTIRIYHTESSNYLFVEMHHIISDGTSLGIFLKDIERAYQNEKLENEKYAGFELALEEEKLLQGEEYKKAERFYDSFLSGVETEFLPEKDYQPDGTGRGMCVLWDDCLETADEYCKKNSFTMNALFMSAFGYLIGKYTNKEEALFTTIYNGRNDSRKHNTVSMLVKTLPVYMKTDARILDLCKNTSKQYVDSMLNDSYPFAEISHKYGVKNDIMFAYQGDNFVFDTFCGKAAVGIATKLDEAKAPLNLNVEILNGKVRYALEYRNDMYNKESMENLLRYYKKVVSEFLIRETTEEIELLDEKAAEEIRLFNDTQEDVENVTTVTLFERQVLKNPDKTACYCDGKSLTYDELNRMANKVAYTLIAAGVKPDDMVGAMIPRFIYAYAVREGILKSGAALMPVDPKYPDDRIEYIFRNSGSNIVVTTEKIASERQEFFESHGIKIYVLEEMLQSGKDTNPKTALTPQNLCYCIYTSGSTGKPKGVMIEHHSLVNFVAYNKSNDQSAEYVENMSVSLALAAFTFDVSVLEEALPLYHGAAVAIATEDEIHNPYALADMMIRTGVDVMKCTPSFMLSIIDEPYVQKALHHLKALDIGAEAFPAHLYNKLRSAGITAKIHNGYGPTEATITTSIDIVKDSRVTIGKPLCNTNVYMLDKYNHIMPVGIPGELIVCGECVGRGYIGMPEVNKEKFIVFHGMPAYRSGDYAKWLSDGRIGFIGRVDNQVKLRGLRVELDEIENAINTYPSIKRSVVQVKENDNGQYLCAYFTASTKVDIVSLAEHMSKTLTAYMIPGVFMQLDVMPMNNNGKVDKKALPEPKAADKKAAGKVPKTELEQKLCAIFKNAIGITDIGVDDDFFQMGGTSLSASKVAMKCIMEKIPIVYANIFEYKTVEKLVAFIESKEQESHEQKEEIVIANQKPGFNGKYGKAESVLQKNTVSCIDGVHTENIGKVLLTGCTGFLGIHVLKKLLDEGANEVSCLVRAGKIGSPIKHLRMLMVYYFNDDFKGILENRIHIVEGDITDAKLEKTLSACEFDTIINCAACVKHFAKDDLIERVNVHGVENLIEVCKKRHKKLVQVSTVSVAGDGADGVIPYNKKMQENELYFGQIIDNQYVSSKFQAEKRVLEAIADGMQGKIIRVGNLMSRYEDGEFQINYHTNGFMNRLRAYAAIGEFPVNNMDAKVEFSPIDKTAEAIIRLAGTPDEYTVFHAYNGHTVHMANVLEALHSCGIEVKPVENDEFQKTFAVKAADEKTCMRVSSLISYMSNDANVFMIESTNEFTTKALYRLGFSWPLIDTDYLKKIVKAMETLGFFDLDLDMK